MFKKIKKAIDRWLKKTEEENKKAFGNERLDCCSMNHSGKK